MNRRLTATLIPAFALAPHLVCMAQGTNASRLEVQIQDSGSANASLSIPSPNSASSSGFTTFFVGVPFGALLNQDIVSAPDILVEPVSRGPDYMVLLVSTPNSIRTVTFTIRNALLLSETREGKAKLSLDVHFGFMSQQDRHLVNGPQAIQYWELRILLPDEHEETELSYEPKTMGRPDERTLVIPDTDPQHLKSGDVWVVFPNPMKASLLRAQLAVFLLLGVLSTIVHTNALRDRRLKWLISTLIVSLCAIAFAGYFSLVLVKRLEFLVAVAALLPHALFSLAAALYLILVRSRQATVTGIVMRDSVTLVTADVRLMYITQSGDVLVRTAGNLEEGRFRITASIPKEGAQYKIVASASGTEAEESGPFRLQRQMEREHEILPINLHALPLIERARPSSTGGELEN